VSPRDPVTSESSHAPELSSGAEIRRKTGAGAILVGARSMAIRALGLGASVVLARLLTPHDFGLVALGNVVMTFGSFLSDGGLAAGLVRGAERPDRRDFETAFGFQLLASLIVTAIVALVGAQLGRAGLLAALMVSSLPLVAFRTPGSIALERTLEYRPLALIEVGETLVYYAWAITTVAIGWGVWGLASAVVVRAAAGSILMLVAGPVGLIPPRISRERLRGLLGFGVRYQGISLLGLIRDEGLNLGTGALAGFGTLGLWSMSVRLLQPPLVVFESLRRVSYPGMSRLRDIGEDLTPVVERTLAAATISAGIILVPLAASAPALVPAVFGARWAASGAAIPPACFGLMLAGPFSVACAGYLLAEGDAGATVRVLTWHTLAWFAVSFSLLSVVGVAALGLGQLAAGLVEVALFTRAVARHIPAFHPARVVVGPVIAALAAGSGGWAVARGGSPSLLLALGVGCLALALFMLGSWLTQRAAVQDLWRISRRSMVAVSG